MQCWICRKRSGGTMNWGAENRCVQIEMPKVWRGQWCWSRPNSSRPRTKPRGWGWGRGQLVEAEDKISASRTVWPRGLNITGRGREMEKGYYSPAGSRVEPWPKTSFGAFWAWVMRLWKLRCMRSNLVFWWHFKLHKCTVDHCCESKNSWHGILHQKINAGAPHQTVPTQIKPCFNGKIKHATYS